MIALRFRQFSIRALIAFVSIGALILGVLGCLLQRARVQRSAVARIEHAGGNVYYAHQVKDHYYTDAPPSVPEWLLDLLGTDFFSKAEVVRLDDCQIDQDTIDITGNLQLAKRLLCYNCTFEQDLDLRPLSQLPKSYSQKSCCS